MESEKPKQLLKTEREAQRKNRKMNVSIHLQKQGKEIHI